LPYFCPSVQLRLRRFNAQTISTMSSPRGSRPGTTAFRRTLFPYFVFAAVLLFGCSAGTKTPSSLSNPTPPSNPPPATVSVSVAPTTANIRAGATFAFSSSVDGSSNTAVTWAVNSVAGGNTTLGTIDVSGNYTAPAAVPNPNTITVTATSAADTTKTANSAVTLWNPTPTLTGISPASTNLGAFTLTITGTNLISGAQVLLNNAPLTTTFVSSTKLTATGNAATPGTYPVAVENPNPGGSTSTTTINFQVNGTAQTSSCSQMSTGAGASLGGFLPFPSDNLWNKDVSAAAVDPNSANIISFVGSGAGIHADFGSGEYQGSYIGIPYAVVDSTQALIPISYQAYGSESDPGPMPIPLTANIEGYPNPGSGDRHVLVLDKSNCFLYELYSSYLQSTSWNADSGAVWDLLADEQRPYTWTSADAAGLPIFPGLVRYDEIAAGVIKHAVRFTVPNSTAAFTPPASHAAGTSSNQYAPPMGARFRLKSSFTISSYSATNQIILTAMKKYGLILADNGSAMYIAGAPDSRWDNDDLHNLGGVTASDFEVVQISPLYTNNTAPTGANPTISSFTASSNTISSGTSVTLSWQVSNADYVIVSPSIGATRGTSVQVAPTATTIYTLYATNAFGRTTSTVQITVH
jgi:IPT/TIG domain